MSEQFYNINGISPVKLALSIIESNGLTAKDKKIMLEEGNSYIAMSIIE